MKDHRNRDVLIGASMFFLPWVPKVLFGLPWLMLQNFTDGVFYLGYAMDFRELVDRVGLNYYAVRFSGIFPDAWAFSLFGPEAGLVVVRYGLAGACCVALFVCFQKRYSTVAGVLAALAWAMNPAAIRFLQTAYVDVTAASFLCIGLGLACLRGVGIVGAGAAGVLFSLAFWGHLHAAVALVFAGPLVVVALWEQGTKRAFLLMGWMLAGFLVPTIAASGFYFYQFGLWDLTSPTRELLKTLRDGHIPAPKLEWVDVVRHCPFWLASVPLAAALCVVPNRSRFLYACFFAFAGYIAFLLWGDVFNGGYSLSLFYYFSFALPGFVFLVGAIIGNTSMGGNGWKVLLAVGAALCGPVLAVGWNITHTPWFLAAMAMISAVPAFFLLRPMGRSFLVALGISVAMGLTAIAPTSRLALGNYWKGDDLPVLSAARELAAILPRHQQKPSPVFFWYDDKVGTDLRMLQSFRLHEFTKWKDADGAYVPFPDPEGGGSVSWHGGAGDLVVLANSKKELRTALDRLQASDRLPEAARQFQIPEASPIAYGALLSFGEPRWREVSNLLDRLEYHRKAKVSESDRLEFLTGPRKWNRDVIVPLPELSEGKALRVVLKVLKGAVAVDMVDGDRNVPGGQPRIVSRANMPVEIFLEPSKTDVPDRLRIRNASPHGVRSRARIVDISVVETIR